jgi:glucokinase
MTELALAIDIGGTKMAAGLVDRHGQVMTRAHIPTRRTVGGEARFEEAELLWTDLVALVGDVLPQAPAPRSVVTCGVGCGGPMRPGGAGVSPLNIAGWRDFPLRDRLHELTELSTYVDNDAKALALGEGWIGAAQGEDNFIGMVVSTGVGGGIVLNGRLLEGRLGNAGHIGHVVVVPEGRACVCGGRGCLEAEASGLAVAAISGGPAADAPPAVVERTGTLVGRAVASTVNLLDLPLAVISGSVALGFGAPFFAAAQQEVDERCRLDFARRARVVPGALGDRGPLVGAARVGWCGAEDLR